MYANIIIGLACTTVTPTYAYILVYYMCHGALKQLEQVLNERVNERIINDNEPHSLTVVNLDDNRPWYTNQFDLINVCLIGDLKMSQ